jgi:hypothetical protein
MGRETTKRLLKKIKRHSQTLLLWACQMWRSSSSYMYIKPGDSCRSYDSAARFLALLGGLCIKATWYSFLRLATLPVHPGSYCCLDGWSRQIYFGTRTHSLSSPLFFDSHGI